MDEKQEEELEKQINTASAFKALFNSKDGEIVFSYLKKICHYDTSTISPAESTDYSQWREGRRSVVLDIDRLSKIDIIKLKENFKKQSKINKDKNEGDSWLF